MNKTDDVKEQVLQEYDNGAKATDLAKKYGISRGTIYLWIDNRRKGTLNFNQNKKDDILRLFKEDHKSVDELSKQFNVSKSTIYQWIAQENIELTPEQTDESNLLLRVDWEKSRFETIKQLSHKIKDLEEKIKYLEDNNKLLTEYMLILKKQLEEK